MSVKSSLCRSCEDIAKCLVAGPQQYGNMALSGVRFSVGFALMAPLLPIFSVGMDRREHCLSRESGRPVRQVLLAHRSPTSTACGSWGATNGYVPLRCRYR